MKRIAALLAALLLIISPALAEVDLSGMTLEELIELHEQLNLLLFEQAKSVTVPQGIWLVGEDIPAGTYLIRCYDSARDNSQLRFCWIKWGTTKPSTSGRFDGNTDLGSVFIWNPNNTKTDEGETTEYVVTLELGMYVFISDSNNKAVFSQYTGPSFSFDW